MSFLHNYPLLMEREREQSNKASSEDESQFTDLLFGDLEEIPLNVIVF